MIVEGEGFVPVSRAVYANMECDVKAEPEYLKPENVTVSIGKLQRERK